MKEGTTRVRARKVERERAIACEGETERVSERDNESERQRVRM